MLLLLIRGQLKKLIEENIYGSYSYIMHLSASTALAPVQREKSAGYTGRRGVDVWC